MRALRNLAAHEYEIDYAATSEHFNSLKELIPRMYAVAAAFAVYCRDTLNITASSEDFAEDFKFIVHS
jgi:hypothetical protein